MKIKQIEKKNVKRKKMPRYGKFCINYYTVIINVYNQEEYFK